MAWLFQGVLNAGLQILLSIFGGWLCARLRLVDPEVMSRNVNLFAMKAAFPAFIIHLLGVKTDLRDAQAWKGLGVFVLWVFIIHLACFIVHKLRRKSSNVLQLGLNCLLLTTNNTGLIGWPVLVATVGQQSAVLSMLLGVLFFIQLLPVTICCFEYYKWELQEGKQLGTGCDNQADDDLQSGDQLPVARHSKDQQQLLAPPPGGFPHEFRYCYWSNELYQPRSYGMLSAGPATAHAAPVDLAQVCVESGDDTDDEAIGHHCYGPSGSSRSSASSGCNGMNSSSTAPSSAAPGREWWRSGRPGKPQAGGLKRAKDSADSLYSPFAAAASAAKQAEMDQQQQQQARPATLGLSSLTRRLSRGLSAAGAAAASAVTAVASPKLSHAASLHTAGSLKGSAGGAPLRKAASLKRAASLRRSGGEDLCQMSVPLMAEHSDEPLSCCPSHLSSSPPISPRVSTAAAAPAGAATGGSLAAPVKPSSSSNTSSTDGMVASAAPATGERVSRTHDAPGQLPAADRAVELHFMCETFVQDGGSKKLLQQQQAQQQLGVKGAAGAKLPTIQSFADLAARGLQETGSRNGSSFSLHTLGGEEPPGRINSDTGRVTSRSNLLPPSGIPSSAAKGASKLGKAPAAVSSNGGDSKPQVQPQQQPRQGLFRGFVQRHPLLCHIVWTQLQSFHLWLNIVAIALSVSGARKYLDASSPDAIPALGFVDGVLSWFSAACIPTLLFANGVWMCGKDMWCGGWKGQAKVLFILLLKLTLLPALMIGLTQLCNLRGDYGLALVLLSCCPLAPLAFLVCQQYGFGAELSTSITIQGVLLMLPQMMAVIKIAQAARLYDVPMLAN